MTSRSDVVSHPFTADLIRRKAMFLSRSAGFARAEEEDLRQEMALFLLTKADLFDSSRGSIQAFATSVLTSWIGMEVRRRKGVKRRAAARTLSLDEEQPGNPARRSSIGDRVIDADGCRRTGTMPRTPVEEAAIRDEVALINAKLTSRERLLLRDVAQLGITGAAKKRKVSRWILLPRLEAIRARILDSATSLSEVA
jgi:hypothetical protein